MHKAVTIIPTLFQVMESLQVTLQNSSIMLIEEVHEDSKQVTFVSGPEKGLKAPETT